MKQLIMDILNRFPENLNWGSISAREGIADAIVDGIESSDITIKKTAEGWADAHDIDEEEIERKKWVCSLCGKSTWEVDWDYIGSGYNHLGCELEIEMAEDRRKKNSESKTVQTLDDGGGITYREKNWSQEKHEEKVFGGDTGIDADFGHNVSDNKQLHEDDWMEDND